MMRWKWSWICWIASALALAGWVSASRSATLRVPGQYPNIQAGINAAARGDTVLVAAGTYTGFGNWDIDFRGVDLVLRSEVGAQQTVIDAQGSQANLHRVFRLTSGETNAAVIDGFTIRRGYTTYMNGGDGAGILCNGASPTIRNCVISECRINGIQYDGGGIFLRNSTARIEECEIRWNYAHYGGGIACRGQGSPTILRCFVHGNLAGYGGGIDAGGVASPRIVDSVIAGNSATEGFEDPGSGGGLILGAAAVVEGCRITGNVSGYGAGVACWSGTPRIARSLIAGNDARIHRGGGITSHSSTVLVEQTVLWGNCAAIGEEFLAGYQGAITFRQCVYDSTGATEDGGQVHGSQNILADPLFCGPLDCAESPSIDGDYRVGRASPCVPDQNPFGIWIGSAAVGCPAASTPEAPPESAARLLGPPHPNPATGAVAWSIDLPRASRVRVRLFDPVGREIETLLDRVLPAGAHAFEWAPESDGRPRPASGIYLLRLEALGRTESRRIVLAR